MIGSILAYLGSDVPEGYLLCDGSAVSRTDYPELFSVIGSIYGDGDGSTTFNLPNLYGRVPIGASGSHVLGSTGGEASHIITEQELASHSHTVPSHTHANSIAVKTPELSHSITQQPSFTYNRLNGTYGSYDAWGSGATFFTGRTNRSMTRSTNFAVADHPATDCTMTGGVIDAPAFDTESTGGGAAHNNMMPFIALVFLIRAA